MSNIPEPRTVEREDNYIHVRYRDPDDFEKIRTPEWADDVSDSVVEGSEVRMGKLPEADDWEPQSVLVPAETDEETAVTQANEILGKLEG